MPKKKKDINGECIQLKNINYQSMLLKRNSNIDSGRRGTENIEKYLEQEQNNKGQKPWSKLEKTIKGIQRNANAKILFFELSLQMAKFLKLKRKFAIN